MIQYRRLPAILTLLAVLAPGTLMLAARHSDATTAKASQLNELQAAIAKPDATATNWLAYAQALQGLKKFGQAAWAYQQLLNLDPSNRIARLQGGSCLALSDSADEFFSFVRKTIDCDPKLAVKVLSTPEAQNYLTEPRFQTLQREAIAQSMD